MVFKGQGEDRSVTGEWDIPARTVVAPLPHNPRVIITGTRVAVSDPGTVRTVLSWGQAHQDYPLEVPGTPLSPVVVTLAPSPPEGLSLIYISEPTRPY